MSDTKNKILFFCTILACSVSALAESDEQIAKDCAKIPVYAQRGADFYQQKEYLKARDAFESQAFWQAFCDAHAQKWHEDKQATAFNNVALTYLKSTEGNRENNLLKAVAWMKILPNHKKSQFNLRKISSEIKRLQKLSYQQAEGTYWQHAGLGTFNQITVKKQAKNRYLFQFQGIYNGWNAPYGGVNMGSAKAVIHFKNHQADFRLPETTCDFSLRFTVDGIHLTRTDKSDDYSCGFGHNVMMEGDYLRVER